MKIFASDDALTLDEELKQNDNLNSETERTVQSAK